jgi:hypothetical protein
MVCQKLALVSVARYEHEQAAVAVRSAVVEIAEIAAVAAVEVATVVASTVDDSIVDLDPDEREGQAGEVAAKAVATWIAIEELRILITDGGTALVP